MRALTGGTRIMPQHAYPGPQTEGSKYHRIAAILAPNWCFILAAKRDLFVYYPSTSEKRPRQAGCMSDGSQASYSDGDRSRIRRS